MNVTNIADFRQKKEAREGFFSALKKSVGYWGFAPPTDAEIEAYEKQFDKEVIILSDLSDALLDMLQDYLHDPDDDLLREIEAWSIVVWSYHGLMDDEDLLPDERLTYSCITWGPNYTAYGQPR
jgi:hypothetical protein